MCVAVDTAEHWPGAPLETEQSSCQHLETRPLAAPGWVPFRPSSTEDSISGWSQGHHASSLGQSTPCGWSTHLASVSDPRKGHPRGSVRLAGAFTVTALRSALSPPNPASQCSGLASLSKFVCWGPLPRLRMWLGLEISLWRGDEGSVRSPERMLLQQDWCPCEKRWAHRHAERRPRRTQRKDGHLQAKERGLRRNQTVASLNLGFLPPESPEHTFLWSHRG